MSKEKDNKGIQPLSKGIAPDIISGDFCFSISRQPAQPEYSQSLAFCLGRRQNVDQAGGAREMASKAYLFARFEPLLE